MQEKLEKFTNELLKWNKTHKLTNYTTKEEIEAQIQDSLYPLEKIKDAKTAIDIGTGAGFPGLILAIAMPDTKWYLVEPLKKRYSFLNYLKTILGLKNVTVVPKRLENADIEPVDLITSRAVMPTPEILKIAKPYLKENSTLLLYKGSNVLDELNGIKASIISKDKRNYIFIKD
ncbi:16S rRNA (guanine(527)-N(7))-methyltransferase RsmG [Caminibacter pacificus]|jgi:16S rRNA (guanine527-N7)-methyltransferase|uniref:Ribosomal RNA small subunit methyltransferase G n=1 Tax=Caminibacter pacificus TaxID=1424653 RepID=A0AAJ4RBP9_9BACT|nr:16S rRNA (guanine(527)-N(7))-methyltransferase RsmG [Caminibacter pacificus]NPA88403.1 16S rRNA (guanine(527)-N(7))-methyltransferase RsmG [Campylobacterota bacterium]QCI28787.1 16S rRNA (guanine(527)-N(7))-methyltransferase RsmG [Caminibacter pacificus]ROR39375.1 16S rRNA m(7)G-527 methyltransferase [Caminibacter pacificus]